MFPDHMRRYVIWLVILLGMAAVAWFSQKDSKEGPAKAGSSVFAKVDRVVDGDTAKVWVDGKDEYVRYIGIDTPESVKPDAPVECFGEGLQRAAARGEPHGEAGLRPGAA